MKVCSRSQKNKRNNICKTSTTHLLQKPYNRIHIIREPLKEFGCKMNACSHFQKNKRNNICKTTAITHIIYP